jgi:hypothetical protein
MGASVVLPDVDGVSALQEQKSHRQSFPKRQTGNVMCEKCETIDKRIGHYREMATHLTDTQTLDGIGILIAKLEADKKALHPEQQ